ncbi:MAG: ParB N-terminal domain-containing protein [Acetobacter sp.]|nr:ParB N-terminal domain-containing protein [Acetobacter sp.]
MTADTRPSLPDQAYIPLVEIDASERLRAIDSDYAAMIAASMMEEGQRTPIEVRKTGKRYRLIAGGHRLEALKIAGKENAWCVIVKANDDEAELLEIDENLVRRELSPLDRAVFLAKRKEVYERLYPETKKGGDRKSDQTEKLFGLIPSFTQETAEKLGLSSRSIEMAVARYTRISPAVRSKIAGTWIADSGSQLDALAREASDMQMRVADFILQWPDVRKVSDIVRQIKGNPPPPAPEKMEKFLSFWRKCDPEEREQIVAYASAQMPVIAVESGWKKASDYHRREIIDFMAPQLPGFEEDQAA